MGGCYAVRALSALLAVGLAAGNDVLSRQEPEEKVWFFGYGSLLNLASREREGADAGSRIVTAYGMRREWNTCAPPPFDFVAVGIKPDGALDAAVDGVIFSGPPEVLPRMDKRERGYVRRELSPDDLRSTVHGQELGHTGTVFAYTQPQRPLRELVAGCGDAPIAQSYLDVVLGGILAENAGVHGHNLARAWLRTTHGWTSRPFVNDRGRPRCMYPLADDQRDTRGTLSPALTKKLEFTIDELMSQVPVNGTHSILSLRGKDSHPWHCDGSKFGSECPTGA